MRLEQFEYLLAVTQCQSMSAAAERLHVSVQSVSKAIKALEEELGASLFVRTRHGVALTADGKTVCQQATIIMEAVHQLQSVYDTTTESEAKACASYPLKILTSAALNADVLSGIKNLGDRFLGLNPAVFINEAQEINAQLLPYQQCLGGYDFILTSMDTKLIPECRLLAPDFEVYFLREDRLGIQMNADDPLALQQKIPLKSLLNRPLVSYAHSSDKQSQLLQLVEDYGIKLTPTFVSNSTQSCANYVKNNRAYGLVTLSMQELTNTDPQALIVVPLQERLALVHLLLCRKSSVPLAPCKALKKFLLGIFPNHQKLY